MPRVESCRSSPFGSLGQWSVPHTAANLQRHARSTGSSRLHPDYCTWSCRRHSPAGGGMETVDARRVLQELVPSDQTREEMGFSSGMRRSEVVRGVHAYRWRLLFTARLSATQMRHVHPPSTVVVGWASLPLVRRAAHLACTVTRPTSSESVSCTTPHICSHAVLRTLPHRGLSPPHVCVRKRQTAGPGRVDQKLRRGTIPHQPRSSAASAEEHRHSSYVSSATRGVLASWLTATLILK